MQYTSANTSISCDDNACFTDVYLMLHVIWNDISLVSTICLHFTLISSSPVVGKVVVQMC